MLYSSTISVRLHAIATLVLEDVISCYVYLKPERENYPLNWDALKQLEYGGDGDGFEQKLNDT